MDGWVADVGFGIIQVLARLVEHIRSTNVCYTRHRHYTKVHINQRQQLHMGKKCLCCGSCPVHLTNTGVVPPLSTSWSQNRDDLANGKYLGLLATYAN